MKVFFGSTGVCIESLLGGALLLELHLQLAIFALIILETESHFLRRLGCNLPVLCFLVAGMW
jgi:hypothetical protein